MTDRLHLHHGPIDLIIEVDAAARSAAFAAAERRFATVLTELVAELPALRQAAGLPVNGAVARRMAAAVAPHAGRVFITPMAAVAGAVADEVMAAMRAAAPLSRAFINNGGDIALHLAVGQRFRAGIAALDGTGLGTIEIAAGQGIGGLATSGLGGRSLTLGIAQSVTVLAECAATADAAATLIANAVDLPGHPAICRTPAADLHPDSDLGPRLMVTGCGTLHPVEIAAALDAGAAAARQMQARGLIVAAVLFLRGSHRMIGADRLPELTLQRMPDHAPS